MIGYIITAIIAFIAGTIFSCYFDVEIKEQVYQEYGGGPLERLIPDTRIEEFREAMEE